MRVTVVGAGMVGVSCALALQQRGLSVTLIDRLPPGSETSHGNAGVLTPSSLIPFNNPALWQQLPALLRGKNPGFRYNLPYLLRQWNWVARFLAHARPQPFERTLTALHALIGHSRGIHLAWLQQAGIRHRLRDNGWIFLYRSETAWQSGAWARDLYTRFGIAFETLDQTGLQAMEPALQPVFSKGVWFPGAGSVDDPAEVVRAYARLFVDGGGSWLQSEVLNLQPGSHGGWTVLGGGGPLCHSDQVVLALGPFSQAFLSKQRLMSLPMAFERGTHMHYAPGPVALNRPIYDTAGGYVLSPMTRGWRLTTGVELNAQQAPVRNEQLMQAEIRAREAVLMGASLDAQTWQGSRPTLPDSRPMIGACPASPGVWLALGHQHIGFSTGPGTGDLLADLMLGNSPKIDPEPFSPERFAWR
ncbi:MAG: D-amino acid dehydrogenase small subunit [Pseudomonadota bacterium]|jgi:D-amino-acid dehydrogenase